MDKLRRINRETEKKMETTQQETSKTLEVQQQTQMNDIETTAPGKAIVCLYRI